MEGLDLTLESELTLFRNRRSHKASESGELTKEMTISPSSPAIDPLTHSEESNAVPVANSENLAAEAARLLDVSLESFEIEDQETGPINPDNIPEQPFEDHDPATAPDTENSPAGAIVPSQTPSKALLPSNSESSATLETYTDPALDDYLESSEVLLQHLDTPIAKRRPLDDSVSLKWFGWAAGVTLILSLLAAFFLQNMFKAPANKKTTETAPQVQAEPKVVPPSPPPTQTKVEGPDLTKKEFPTVNPSNISSLPTPEPAPAPSPPESSTSTSSPSPTDNTTPGRQYYVVTNYTNEASLDSAKQLIPEAKVVNFTAGTRIQLKQFSNEAEARTAAAQLQQQGLAVEILATASE